MIIFIIILIAAVLLFPYGWALFHRHRMLKRLRQKCVSLEFEWKPLHQGILFSMNLSKKYDLCLEGKDSVYLIKLWSCFHRGTTLWIDEEGRVFEGRRCRLPIVKDEEKAGERWQYSRFRRVPRTLYKGSVEEGKKINFVFLSYPTYDRVVRRVKGQDQPIFNGSLLFGKRFYTPSALEAELIRDTLAAKNSI